MICIFQPPTGPTSQLADACKVIAILDPRFKYVASIKTLFVIMNIDLLLVMIN